MKQPVFRDKHFYILIVLFVICAVLYYFGELVDLFAWEALRFDIFFTVHDLHRVLFLAPILYSSYYYRLRGALLANVTSLLIFLPRAFFIVPELDATVRLIAFVIIATILSTLMVLMVNERDKLHKSFETLKQAEEKYRNIMEQMYDSYYEMDLAGKFTFVNDSVCRNLGYSRGELIGNNYRLTVPEDDIKTLLLAFNAVFRTGEPNKGFEHRVLCKDGSILFAESSISLRKNEQGEIIGFRSITQDITERKRTEEALRESEAQYRLLSEHMTDTIWLMDMNLKTIYQSPSILKVRGFTVEEILEMPVEKHLTPESLKIATDAFLEELPKIEADPNYDFVITLDLEYYRKDGTTMWSENKFSVIRDVSGKAVSVLGEARDITDRRKAEAALRESEGKYRLLSEHMTDTIWLMDMNLKTTYQSPSAEKLRGFTLQEIRDMPLEKRLTPESLKLAFEVLSEEIPRIEADPDYNPVRKLDIEYYCKDGTTVWTETKFSVIQDPSGKPVSILSEARDITDRRKAEEALRESQEKYRSLVENINDVFYTLDNQGNITYVSPVVERFTQYKVSDLIGKPFTPLIYPDDLPGLLDSLDRLVSGELEPWEFRILDKDGRVIFVRTSSRPLYKDGEMVGIAALMTDITERKQMEQKLEEMATHDHLTGLPNRVLLLDRFRIAEAMAHRNKTRLAIMSLDLDKFKTINDTLGHEAGDQVLKNVSARLKNIIRASDTLARIGGDEFVLVMQETKRREDATAIAQKIVDSFAEPMLINGHSINVSTSIGIAIYPDEAEDLETLIKKSDAAMYYSKGHGRNRFKFFSDGDVRMGGDHRSGPPVRD